MDLNIIIAGEGGQGVQKIAEILAQAAFSQNLKTTYIPNFTVQQRGGVSLAFVRISEEPIIYPKFEKADLAVVLSGRSVERIKNFLTPNTRMIYNSTLVSDTDISNIESRHKDAIAATQLAKELNPRVFNIIMLGRIVKQIEVVNIEAIAQELKKIFGRKYAEKPALEEQNNKALQIGFKS